MTQLFLDIECFKNYFLIMFYATGGKTKSFELYPGTTLNYEGVWSFILNSEFEFITFNGNNYDKCMLAYALSGANNAELKRASDAIIENDMKPWEFEKAFGVEIPKEFNHIDLIEVAPGVASLKIYGARLHLPRLQDLPFPPDAFIEPEQRLTVRTYCRNDLMGTSALYYALLGQIELRRVMSKDLNMDVRSKSDAQIAEAVLKTAIIREFGYVPQKVPINYSQFRYTPPSYIGFGTEQLQAFLRVVESTVFKIKDTGHVEMPEAIDNYPVVINGRKYKIGLGGIHSQESEQAITLKSDEILKDIDVVSYYPNLMLNMGMYPAAIGESFLVAYRKILDERVAAKRAKDKVKDGTLKITLNGTFGKTANKYSILYNPKMMIYTTITGQLSILMLIEALEAYGISVMSANTDGILVHTTKEKEVVLRKIVAAWEKRCNLQTDETDYRAMYARDVNNYIALKTDGSIKTKGFFAPAGLSKNPQNEVCTDAVIAYLTQETDIGTYIKSCRDIRKFLTVRTVNGGAHKDGYTLGKAIRWYYAKGETGAITYKTNGNLVARSEGAKPLMDLPDEFPNDVDFEWYIKECQELLMDLGVVKRPPKVKLPRKNSKEWKRMVEEGLITV